MRSRSLYGFVPRKKKEKNDTRRKRRERKRESGEGGGKKERERKGKGQRLPMDEYASSRDEKDELKCESAGAEGG